MFVFTIVFGLTVTGVGFYFRANDMTSSGPVYSKYSPMGTRTINGNGMIILGAIITALGVVMATPKNKKD